MTAWDFMAAGIGLGFICLAAFLQSLARRAHPIMIQTPYGEVTMGEYDDALDLYDSGLSWEEAVTTAMGQRHSADIAKAVG